MLHQLQQAVNRYYNGGNKMTLPRDAERLIPERIFIVLRKIKSYSGSPVFRLRPGFDHRSDNVFDHFAVPDLGLVP
jgi:hypothetical protein